MLEKYNFNILGAWELYGGDELAKAYFDLQVGFFFIGVWDLFLSISVATIS